MSLPAGSFAWLLSHEARLVARSFPGGAGGSFFARNRSLIFWGAALALILHGVAATFSKTLRAFPADPDPAQLMALSFYILIGFAILVARGLDSVTQLLYSRADLDLLLSSPLSQNRIFSARLVAVAVQTVFPALFFTAPFAHMAAFKGDPRWLAIYPLILALSALATATAAGIATLMFAAIGARRTRLVAQIVATLLATGIGVGAQLNRLLPDHMQYSIAETVERWSESSAFAAASPLVWPARGLLGNGWPMLELLALAAFALAVTGRVLSRRLAANAVAALGADMGVRDRGSAAKKRGTLFLANPHAVLRRKEWTIAMRSPWLIAELLTPLIYLVPPVLVLSKAAAGERPPLWLMASAIAMLAGQIAAGVSRLMISGEDAPELVATAPVTADDRELAKVLAVVAATAVLMALPLALVFWNSLFAGLCGLAGSFAAVMCVCCIHLWFRGDSKRHGFQGRAKVSLTVNIADQIAGLLIAAATGFAIQGSRWALPAAAAVSMLMYAAWRRRGLGV